MGEGIRPTLYAPLILRPGFSRRLALYLLAGHGLALTALLPLPLPLGIRVAGILLILASLAYNALLHLWRRLPWAIREAVWDGLGVWHLEFPSGARVTAQLLPHSWVSLGLVILDFRLSPWHRRALVLPADALPSDRLRQLRVRLRLERANPKEDSGTAESPSSSRQGGGI